MKFSKHKKTIRKSGRGSVALIAILLIASGILRLASGTGIAFANVAVKPNGSANLAADANKSAPSLAGQSSDRATMSKLLVALQAREAQVKDREAQLQMRSKALAVVDEEIAKRLAALEQAEVDLRATLALADNAAENDLARLTSVYENMKPKDAAALFETMEPDFAAGFLGRMRPDAAASVMAGLTPGAAYSISVILASRNANAPKS
ncbi:MAG: MotE family protein [Sulfitobacter sp.]